MAILHSHCHVKVDSPGLAEMKKVACLPPELTNDSNQIYALKGTERFYFWQDTTGTHYCIQSQG